MKKHPVLTYIYVWTINIIAISLFIYSLYHFQSYSLETWISFGIWTIILSVGRVGGFFKLIGIKILSGWATAIELAAAIVLPFPLLCMSTLISTIFIFGKRIKNKHPEPFLGPDFNASNNMISAFVSRSLYNKVNLLFSHTIFKIIVPLLTFALVYAVIQVSLLTILISIDLKKNWKEVGTVNLDSLLSEAILIITGTLLGLIYDIDPFLIILMLIPLLLLHSMLDKVNRSKLVYLDEKTKLYNYRYFDEKLRELFKKATEDNTHISLIFADMDHLRDVNNNYGHPVGDKALKTVAGILNENKSSNIIPVRFGGEEFVLILSGYDKTQTGKIAEEIRKKIEKKDILLDDENKINVTMSFGVASYPEDVSEMDELIKSADDSVYVAKKSGRNKVVLYDSKSRLDEAAISLSDI